MKLKKIKRMSIKILKYNLSCKRRFLSRLKISLLNLKWVFKEWKLHLWLDLLLFIKLDNLLIYWKNAYFFSCQLKSYKVLICFLSWAVIIILCNLILKWLILKSLNIWMRKFIIFPNTCLKRRVISMMNIKI